MIDDHQHCINCNIKSNCEKFKAVQSNQEWCYSWEPIPGDKKKLAPINDVSIYYDQSTFCTWTKAENHMYSTECGSIFAMIAENIPKICLNCKRKTKENENVND